MRILLAQIDPTVGDLAGNREKILKGIAHAKKVSADLVLFPELALSGYPPEDLLLLPHFITAVEAHLEQIIPKTEGITAIIGLPRRNPALKEKGLFNSAAIIQNKQLLGYQDKTLLPTYDVFDERRYFEPCNTALRTWNIQGKKVAVTICEDIWQHAEVLTYTLYERDPVEELKILKPDLLLNLSASPYSASKHHNRLTVCSRAAKALQIPLLYCNQVGGNDSLIFDGYSFYIGADGTVLNYAKGFEEDCLLVDLSEPIKAKSFHPNPIEDLYRALTLGLRDYFRKQGFQKACVGLSGGIDSALVICIACEALGKEHVLAVGLPSRFSSQGSVTDSIELCQNLGIPYRQISIEGPFQAYLDLLEPQFGGKPFDATEENIQARIRGMILMAISNKEGYIVLSTGNKSELAMGYATLYGDMCGGLGVISDVTKRQVYALARWINRNGEVIPNSIITKPPSAELKENQKDSDSLPPYEIIDNVLQAYVEQHQASTEIAQKFQYPLELVQDLIQRIHRNEYKRRQSAPGLRVSEKSFSVGRRFPIVQKWD